MPTQIIDTTIKGNAFPSGYAGAGTLLGHPVVEGNSTNRTDGFFTSTGDPVQINTGFQPRKITVFNETDGIKWEWYRGMAAANSIKILLGGSPTLTKDTSTAFVIAGRAITLSAALCGTAKNIIYHIED